MFFSQCGLTTHIRRLSETNLFSIYISFGETLTWPWNKQNTFLGGLTFYSHI